MTWNCTSQSSKLVYCYVFSANSFFNKRKAEDGEAAVQMMYKAMRHQYNPKDTNIISYGEVGTKYYIILKGEVSLIWVSI